MGIINNMPGGFQPSGTLSSFTKGTSVTGYLPCDGRVISETTYPQLFQDNGYGSVVCYSHSWTGALGGSKITVAPGTSSSNKDIQHEVGGSIIVGPYQYLIPDLDSVAAARAINRTTGGVLEVGGSTLAGYGTYSICYMSKSNRMYYIEVGDKAFYYCTASTAQGMTAGSSTLPSTKAFRGGGSASTADVFFWSGSTSGTLDYSVSLPTGTRTVVSGVADGKVIYDPVTKYFYAKDSTDETKIKRLIYNGSSFSITTTSMPTLPNQIYNGYFAYSNALYKVDSSGSCQKWCDLDLGSIVWNNGSGTYQPSPGINVIGDYVCWSGYYSSSEGIKYAFASLEGVENFKGGKITAFEVSTGAMYGGGTPMCMTTSGGLNTTTYPYIVCWHGYSSSYTYAFYGWRMNLKGVSLQTCIADLTDENSGKRAYVKL